MALWESRTANIAGTIGGIAVVLLFVSLFGGVIYMIYIDVTAEDLEYRFDLLREEVELTVLDDGSVDIDYTFEFINSGDLDGVDVGEQIL
jgi:hypothetical protein